VIKLSFRALLNLDENCYALFAVNTLLTVHIQTRFYMTFKWDFKHILKMYHPQITLTMVLQE